MSNEHVNSAFHYALSQIAPPIERDMRPIAAAIAPLATMGQPVKPPVYPIVEVSDDENTATVTIRFEFVQSESYRCRNCDACCSDNVCDQLPCGLTQRKDGRSGYFREVRG